MRGDNQQRDLALLARIRAGDGAAKEELVEKYIPMVKHIARHHYSSFLEFEDLMQEGLIGLLGAIEEYRPTEFNVKFSSFAYLCILRKVYNAIKQTNNSKHKALNDAISLHSCPPGDDARPMLERCDDASLRDPLESVAEKLTQQHLKRLLRSHLSLLEYTVFSLLLQGYTVAEIERAIGVSAKVVDNARTRVRLKLRRLVERYGSLLDPRVPLAARRRKDLYVQLKVSLSG
ncbi:MAG: sigma-70 family RNA polymerase sigma factor [Limnochordales bacterium]|nr:sigma-70 family RNA polymerase sigma factor [Limnochordales bacterium]